MLGQFTPSDIFAFFLVFARIGAAVMLLPGIGEQYVMARIRLAFALALTVVILPLVREGLPGLPAQPVAVLALIVNETMFGLFVGGAARLMISSLHVAGVIIAFQSGLAFAQTVDPNQGSQGAIVGTLMTMLGILIIFITGMHALLIGAMLDSYQLFPAGDAPPAGDFAQFAVETVSSAFAIGLQMATPFVVFGIVFYSGIAVLQRLMPQVQLFFVAMPLQIMLSILLMTTLMSAALFWFLPHFEESITKLLAPA